MKNKLLIKNGLLVLENEIVKRDILIVKDRIEKISPSLKKRRSVPVLDARNRYIMPGGIDVHTHMELDLGKGMVSADDYRNGSRAGLLGGITCFFGFAYQKEHEKLIRTIAREKKKAARSHSSCNLHVGVESIQDDIEAQIKRCIKSGYHSFKVHLNHAAVDHVFLLKFFRALFKYNGIAFLHCEDGRIIQYLRDELAQEKKTEVFYYPRTCEDYVEKLAIDTVINLARRFETKIYIAHLSSRLGLSSIKRAKEESEIWIEAETSPQYLLFTENIYKENDGYLYTCSPSFKHKIDSDSLWEGLKKGIIKVISSDHCPFTRRQKEKGRDDFTKAALGLPGIQTLYPLILSEGRKRKVKVQEIVKWVSTNPAKIFNLYPEKGVIRKNSQADLVIYNPEETYRITHKELSSPIGYSPYEGWRVRGRIESVILQGRLVVKDHRLILPA